MPPRLAARDEYHSSESQKQLSNGSLLLPPLSVPVSASRLAPSVRPETIRYPDANHLPACSPSLRSGSFRHYFPCKNQFWISRKYIPVSQDRSSGSLTAVSSAYSVPDCLYSPTSALAYIQKSGHMPFSDSRSISFAASPLPSAEAVPANAPYFLHEQSPVLHQSAPPL